MPFSSFKILEPISFFTFSFVPQDVIYGQSKQLDSNQHRFSHLSYKITTSTHWSYRWPNLTNLSLSRNVVGVWLFIHNRLMQTYKSHLIKGSTSLLTLVNFAIIYARMFKKTESIFSYRNEVACFRIKQFNCLFKIWEANF